MKNYLLSVSTLFFVIVFFTSFAYAGKGANTYGCVNLSVKPQSPVSFTFTPVSTNCMNDTGSAVTFSASTAGVTCGSIGYVEAKGSGWCAFESSTWNLSYAAPGTSWSGSTQSTWATGSGITLSSFSPKTSVNTSPSAGTATSVDWNNQGPIYIIFTPGATSALSLSDKELFLNSLNQLVDQQKDDADKLTEEFLASLVKVKDLKTINKKNKKYSDDLEELYDDHVDAISDLSKRK